MKFDGGGIRCASDISSKKTIDNSETEELKPLYLDAQSTTPMDPRVLDAMMPYFTVRYGNPHSRTHAYGWESEAAVEKAREVIFVQYFSVCIANILWLLTS